VFRVFLCPKIIEVAKDLPYFKFNVSEWNDGDITLCSMTAQGLFINLCSLYWSQEGQLSITKCKRRFKDCNTTVWDELVNENIIKVTGDNIVIHFLDEQFSDRERLSETNKKNVQKRWNGHKNTTVLRTNKAGKQPVYNIEERREEERDIVTHGQKNKYSITVRRVFANDPIHKIYDLAKYFASTDQLDDLDYKGWIHFDEFMQAHAGKIFNEPDHLYNSFKNFCTEFTTKPKTNKFQGEELDKSLWTLEAWEKHYEWKLQTDNEFRKHFGYEELRTGK
jgi:hypothetical protein